MKHYGDICKMNGAEVERVECVIGGSPCQDLSVAGKRAGLAGERSGLFMEQIRLIKEMRTRDEADGRTGVDVFPRFMVCENVPGAFSSNRGEDFRAVLEETARIADETVSIPRYEGGRWTNAGAIIGDGWSIAWRLHDAQFWGVPQRRKRIALVADFGGFAAPEILFERKGLSGDSAESGAAGKGAAGDYAGCAYPSVAGTLRARADGSPRPDRGNGAQIVVQSCLNPWDTQSARIFSPDGVYHTLNSRENSGLDRSGVLAFKLGNGDKARGIGLDEELAPTLNAECGGNKPAICIQGNCIDRSDTAGCNGKGWNDEDVCYTLNTIDRPAVAYDARGNGDGETVPTITGDHESCVTDYTAVCVEKSTYQDVCGTLNPGAHPGSYNGQDANNDMLVANTSLIRRLTPLEATRCQGFPDGWVDLGDWTDEKGRTHKEADAPKYKALGNSIALPFWYWLLNRISDHCEEKTMGSLFSGIGGFDLCWQMINGDGSCRWSSEIDSYCIAVLKKHFGDEHSRGDWSEYVQSGAK